ncbi:NAD(P)H-binding protein [soil metagenome]
MVDVSTTSSSSDHDGGIKPKLLLTGATGFVGGAVLDHFRGTEPIRCLVRDASKLDESPSSGVEVAEADLSDPESLEAAFDGIEQAYYLVHSMEAGTADDFAERDREAAQNFVDAGEKAGLKRSIYLGGVTNSGEESEHIESRNEVEQILEDGPADLVALRASMVIGAHSDSFLTLVQLVDRLPVLALPTWKTKLSQPVAIADVVAALHAARTVEPGTYDIGGPEVLTFEELTEIVSGLLGQKHRSFPLPFSNSKLEALVASAVVDADRDLLAPLMAGLHSNLIADDNRLASVFGVEPTPFKEAAHSALEELAAAGEIDEAA